MNQGGSEKKYSITVSIDSPTLYTLKLSIDELEVAPEDARQLIEWKLDDALSGGGAEFVDLGACKPGFEWISTPPPSPAIFDKASRVRKDSIEIRDTHKKNGNSNGTWIYKLRVSYDGHVYETPVAVGPASGDTRAYLLIGSNPIIINR